MSSKPHQPLSAEVQSRLSLRYGSAGPLRSLFCWLWDEVKAAAPEATCEVTKRYIAFFRKAGSRKALFAYVDLQDRCLKVGVPELHYHLMCPDHAPDGQFPEWNGSRPFVSRLLRTQDPQVAEIVTGCYRFAG